LHSYFRLKTTTQMRLTSHLLPKSENTKYMSQLTYMLSTLYCTINLTMLTH